MPLPSASQAECPCPLLHRLSAPALCFTGEQLLQEATLDAADTMLASCSQPPALPQPHVPLITAALHLVANATAFGDATGGGEGGEPPVGLVELALKLWRSCVAALQPPVRARARAARPFHSSFPQPPSTAAFHSLLPQPPSTATSHRAVPSPVFQVRAELAPQLHVLAQRLPALIELGDELIRPAMLLVDWCVLGDAWHGVCGGTFVAAHVASLAPVFERALTAGHTGPGTLASIASLHTLLLGAPAHAAQLAAPFAAALSCLLAPEDDDGDGGQPNDLMLAAMAVLLGRLLLVAPPVFQAVVAQVATALALPNAHVLFGQVRARLPPPPIPVPLHMAPMSSLERSSPPPSLPFPSSPPLPLLWTAVGRPPTAPKI